MINVNENFLKLKAGYLFPEIGRRIEAFKAKNPDAKLISLGVGDVTGPLAPAVIEAMKKAVDEMGDIDSFRGYDDGGIGYEFLRKTIIENDFNPRGIELETDEVIVSDGSKSDTGNIGEIFGLANVVAVADPVYPVYVDTNVMAGRTKGATETGQFEGIVYMPCTAENNFAPALPAEPVELIYLCFPNNPTGAVVSKEALRQWVDYAKDNKAVILFDAAYEAFITDGGIPHSIYEIEGAKDVAIEFHSFSKSAGFTGVRCAFTVVPKQVKAYTGDGRAVELNKLWRRRQCTKFNGVSYISQCAAAAVYSPQGKKQNRRIIDIYMKNAALICRALGKMGYQVYGGVNAPYIWLKTPDGVSSWDFFDLLLQKANVVGTPGAGFGPAGEGYFRLTAFGRPEDTAEAMKRFAAL